MKQRQNLMQAFTLVLATLAGATAHSPRRFGVVPGHAHTGRDPVCGRVWRDRKTDRVLDQREILHGKRRLDGRSGSRRF